MKTWRRAAVVFGAVLIGTAPAWSGEPTAKVPTISLDPCNICHDVLSKQFESNPHHALRAVEPGVGTPCESCHGNGAKHADSADPADIKRPKGIASNQVCATCHASVSNTAMTSEAHAAGGVGCVDCHTIHQTDMRRTPLLRAEVTDLCASCHPTQYAEFSKPFSHELGIGDMSCASCHNPHGGRGEESLKGAERDELVCVTCHTEKRGPFVFDHVNDEVGNCMTCHEPHGSSNPKRLVRAQVDQLCLECHSPLTGATAGSQPPSFHDLTSPRYRQCTVCHVAVHGSNTSPVLLK
jgi:DmsE family decaheme c-type cytochrome